MVGGCTPSKQATLYATIQATHHATIQTSNVLGTVCSFPSTDRHVRMRSFPETSGKHCGSQRWGQGSQPDTCACSATQTTLRLLRLGFMACMVGWCPWLSAQSRTDASGTHEHSWNLPGSLRKGLAGAAERPGPGQEKADRESAGQRGGSPWLVWSLCPLTGGLSAALATSGLQFELQTAPAEGPWLQAATGWAGPGLGGSAA
jgi:hypothetical protein